MNFTKFQEKRLIEASNKYLNVQFKDSLIKDFEIEQQYADGIVKSASIAELYIDMKGLRECKLLGFANKFELLKMIMSLSDKNGWVAFNKISNIRSFSRKISRYKTEREKGIYEGLSFLVSKNKSNRVTPNARKITDKQLETLIAIKRISPNLSKPKIYERMEKAFDDLEIKEGAIAYYLRNLEVTDFKNKIELE